MASFFYTNYLVILTQPTCITSNLYYLLSGALWTLHCRPKALGTVDLHWHMLGLISTVRWILFWNCSTEHTLDLTSTHHDSNLNTKSFVKIMSKVSNTHIQTYSESNTQAKQQTWAATVTAAVPSLWIQWTAEQIYMVSLPHNHILDSDTLQSLKS
jgi:hypothetical protein